MSWIFSYRNKIANSRALRSKFDWIIYLNSGHHEVTYPRFHHPYQHIHVNHFALILSPFGTDLHLRNPPVLSFQFQFTIARMPTHHDSDDLDNLGRSFLKDLPPSIKRFTYRSESQFLDILDSESALFEFSNTRSEFLLFHATKETIKAIFNSEPIISIARLCSSFDSREMLLLIKMPSQAHSAASAAMNTKILKALIPMGLFDSLQGYAGATIRDKRRGRRKQPDYGWGPQRRAPDQPSTPSVTLEVAYSESVSKLNSDVRFWLSPGQTKANICLTLRINRTRPEIRIEKWQSLEGRIHRSQSIWITRKQDRPNVTGYPLVIPFESLFRRASTRPGEKDLEIAESELEQVAEIIWQEQGWYSASSFL